jgi:Fur family ferric uptake transcriptional regulator
MTKSRKAVLDILSGRQDPVTAGEVFAEMTATVDQATVYRTLHYLEENGFADSFVLHCTSHGTERYYTATANPSGASRIHRHWFHCEQCHRFTDLGGCKLDELVRGYEAEYGVQVKMHTLYLTGVCAECRK